MEMKRILSVIALLMVLSSGCMASGQRHRHHPDVIGLIQHADTTLKELPTDTAGNDAFSDTTSVLPAPTHAQNGSTDDDEWDEDFTDVIGFGHDGSIKGLFSMGIVFALLICLAPFILLGFILWMIVRNRNQRYRLVEKAMEQGRPIPAELVPTSSISNDQLWRKAIRNIFLGIGLAIFFACWDANFLSGLGWLLCFYGIGQAVIYKTTNKKDDSNLNPNDSKPYTPDKRDREI